MQLSKISKNRADYGYEYNIRYKSSNMKYIS